MKATFCFRTFQLRRNRLKTKRTVLSCLVCVFSLCLVLMVCWKSDIPFTSNPPHETLNNYTVDCAAIYDMDPVEIGKALVLRNQVLEERDESLVNLTSDCDFFLDSRGYRDVCISQQEKNFPIAYSIVVHKKALMVERLIKALYTPSNIFCIHYDRKCTDEFVSAMEGLAKCLPNVFIASKRESVYYASIYRLKADLNCMSDLVKSEVQWKYIINLCGQDFPLKTNLELVSELTRLNGGNMLETQKPGWKTRRFNYRYVIQGVDYNKIAPNETNQLKVEKFDYDKVPIYTGKEKEPPPHGLEMFIGSAYFVLSREFAEFMQTSNVVKDFLEWSEDTYTPDEHFWATLARLPGVPGEIPRSDPDITDLMSKTRLVKWSFWDGRMYPPCTGTYVRQVCVYGMGDLHWLLNYGHWFANKFDTKTDRIVIQCLEENLQKKNKLLQSMASPICY